jgi:hypothetical protein
MKKKVAVRKQSRYKMGMDGLLLEQDNNFYQRRIEASNKNKIERIFLNSSAEMKANNDHLIEKSESMSKIHKSNMQI